LSGTVAAGALSCGGHHPEGGALLSAHHAAAAAVGTHLRRGPRLTAGAVAGVAALQPGQADLLFTAEGRFGKIDGQVDPQALPPLGTAAGAGSRAAEASEPAAEEG